METEGVELEVFKGDASLTCSGSFWYKDRLRNSSFIHQGKPHRVPSEIAMKLHYSFVNHRHFLVLCFVYLKPIEGQ